MPPFADVTFSSESLAVVSALLGAVTVALVWVVKAAKAQSDAERADLRRQRDDLLRVVLRFNLGDHIPDSVPHAAIPPPPPAGPTKG